MCQKSFSTTEFCKKWSMRTFWALKLDEAVFVLLRLARLFELGLIHTRHFGTQYCDKKIISSHMFQWPTKVSSEKTYLDFFKELTLAYRDPWPKNVFLSQYLFIAILCAKMSRVNKALEKPILTQINLYFFVILLRQSKLIWLRVSLIWWWLIK